MGDAPIPMRLTCPSCGELHIDVGEFATKPHHTHACQHCGMVWRPAVVETVGVRFLPRLQERGGDRIVTVRPLDPAVIATDRGADRPTSAEDILDLLDAIRPAWHAQAACRGQTDVMFPVGDPGKGRDTASAMLLCARCGVRVECADYGANEPDGVWGGQYVGIRASRRGPRSSATAETIDAMNDGTWWTAAQLAARLGISRESAHRRLSRLSRSDVVEIRVGNGCTPTEYRLKETT